ncbi:MAG TPA: NifB/NifX family molybdenum-iron cluster-binding protein [Candidatus Acidoferrales bacterium]|nr:NifB/NifX family molybdenum-iron cluster-binding protein [Candidatus Acidoferrales bacterium]HXK03078.1 NifB/NifX family molybdenum-iron cluster-binding protein [Verrucomicrobiae bacterium]
MTFTRLAIATCDGFHVCDHLARSKAYVVLEIHNGEVLSRTVRTRATTECGNHTTFVDMLTGCDAVICGGIGEGAAVSLSAAGIAPLVTTQHLTVAQAVRAWIGGTLVTSGERVCLCSH